MNRDVTAAAALTEETRPLLQSLLLACADTKLLLGYHYLEWTFGAPALEAGIAACAMGQDELGHARLLHGVLQQGFGLDQEHLLERRPVSEFASASFLDRPLPRWASLVAANAIVDPAVSLILDSFRGSGFGPLARVVEKMLEEERHHLEHGRGWFSLLMRRGGETRDTMLAAAREAIVSAEALIGPPRGEAPLVDAGLRGQSTDEVRMGFGEHLADLAETAALGAKSVLPGGALFVDPKEIEWIDWDLPRRRIGAEGPDEEMMRHLRGTKNVQYRKA